MTDVCNKESKNVKIEFYETNITMMVGETKSIVPIIEVGKKVT